MYEILTVVVYSIWKVHRNCWPLCRRCFLWLHIIYSFHVNLWVSGICTIDSAKLICRLGTYELKVVSKSHSNFLYPKHGRSIKASLKHAPNIFGQNWLWVNLRYFGSTYFQTWFKQFYEHNNIWTFNMWYKCQIAHEIIKP